MPASFVARMRTVVAAQANAAAMPSTSPSNVDLSTTNPSPNATTIPANANAPPAG
jgi:hypothetical protein